MKLRFLKILSVMILAIIFISPGVQAQDKEILAKIGTKTITTADLNRVIGYYEPEQQKVIENNPQIKENILWQIVRSTVIAQVAKKKGFDKKPEIRNQQEMIINNFLATIYLQKEVVEKVTITENKARAYYQDHGDLFKTPEMIRVKHILIKTESTAPEEEKKKAKAKAEETLKKLKDGGDFSKLATEVSEDPGTKDKGGDLDFFPKGTMIPAFEEVAFALKPGEISGLVETEYGYHVIKMEEKKDALLEPYEKIKDKVKDQALQEMRKEAVTEFVEKALKNAGAEIKPESITKPKK
ncbi:MAG: peptidylprolyl isomerase [Deltaproteobacteria bacterium]|nr:peptidylprolyl isomerase [Deltaproteobacteria bacterium]